MWRAIRFTLTQVLKEEVTTVIGAERYEQYAARSDQKNGSYSSNLGTSVGKIERLEVPRNRAGYQTQVFARYQRRQAHLDSVMIEMYIGGVST